jgi:hypothetical protein
VAGHTLSAGHVADPGVVEDGVNHQLHTDSSVTARHRRPHRCFRHRVWMAACDDCRTAHTARLIKVAPAPVPTDPAATAQDEAGH